MHEIVRVPEITSVPDSPGCVQGVINLRGKIVSVVDLRRRFGEKEIKPTKKNRILVTEVHGKLVGLIVDSASEVLKIPESDIELPPVFDQGELNYVTGVGKLNGRLIILIDLNRILQKGELRRIAEVNETRAAAVPSRDCKRHLGRKRETMATPSLQIQISEPEYKLLQTLVYQECGMYFDERRAHFLQDRLQRRLKICGLDTFYAYYRLLTSYQGKAEMSALVENLTVNETSFFPQ